MSGRPSLEGRGTLVVCLIALLASCSDRPNESIESSRIAAVETNANRGQSTEDRRVVVDPSLSAQFEKAPGSRQPIIVALRELPRTNRVRGRMYGTPQSSVSPDQGLHNATIATAQGRLVEALEQSEVGDFVVRHRYRHFPMIALEIGEEHLAVLGGLSDVVSVTADERGEAELASSLPFLSATALHDDGVEGGGTAVAILDTPVRYWATDGGGDGYFGTCPAQGDWSPGTPGCGVVLWEDATSPPVDIEDLANRTTHGTSVAGIVRGVAPGTDILSINVFRWDPSSGGAIFWMSDVVAGLDRVVDHVSDHSIVSVNLSLGGNWPAAFPCDSLEVIPESWPASVSGFFPTAYFDPIETLWDAHGIPVVAATGNGASSRQIKSPACTTLAISVAASFDTELDSLSCEGWTQSSPRVGEVACFSNINRTVDVVAPGVWIDAAGTTRTYGTSNAAPHASGAIALLQSSWEAALGHHLEPHWVHRRLMLAGIPFDHDGVVQRSLNVGRGVDEDFADAAFSFGGYSRADSSGEIPATPGTYTESFDVAGAGVDVEAALLYLEVIHPAPQDLEVTVTAPDGSTATATLPGGGPNFNAIIGRDVLIGALDALTGGPTDGTWTLELSDNGDSGPGFYIGATVFIYGSSCVAECAGKDCGDDGCGGSCGACSDEELCSLGGTCEPCSADCGSRSCGDDRCGGSCGGCDDGLFCNGWEHCVTGGCSSGVEPCLIPDDLSCTRNCEESTDRCNAPRSGYCVIDETCVDEGTPNPDNPCEECLSEFDRLAWSSDDTNICDDDDACTTVDACVGGVCLGDIPPDCDDDNLCTDDACDSTDGCFWVDNTEACDDDDACTIDDTCGGGVCVPGELLLCDDDNLCTDDICDSASGCVFSPNTEPCDDESACTEGDVCTEGSCVGDDVDCGDDDACTVDSCDTALGCEYEAVVCDDDDECTIDSCDPATGCVFETISCDDDDECTVDSCDPDRGCEYAPVECDDVNECTDDTCDPATGCVFSPNTEPCDDGDDCTADDLCVEGECQSGIDTCIEEDGCSCGVVSPTEPISVGRSVLLSLIGLAKGW